MASRTESGSARGEQTTVEAKSRIGSEAASTATSEGEVSQSGTKSLESALSKMDLGSGSGASFGAGLDNPNPIVKPRYGQGSSTRGEGLMGSDLPPNVPVAAGADRLRGIVPGRPEVEAEDDEVEPLEDEELQDVRDVIWDMVSRIKDPEFNYSLEDLYIVRERSITVSRFETGKPMVEVIYKPTVPHCSQALTIGLCLAHAVSTSIPGIKYSIKIQPGTHLQEHDSTYLNRCQVIIAL